VLSSLYPVVTVVLSIAILRERMTRSHVVGIVLTGGDVLIFCGLGRVAVRRSDYAGAMSEPTTPPPPDLEIVWLGPGHLRADAAETRARSARDTWPASRSSRPRAW